MKLTFYGHATFLVDVQGKKILFDPFITGNPSAQGIDANSVEADFIFISHGHADHIGDAVGIAKRTGATCVAAPEVTGWLEKQGVENVLPLNHGGFINFPFGKVKAVNAIHSSSLPDGSYGGNPLGYIFATAEGDFYFAGDTALTLDMQLIPLYTKLSFAILPIGGHFTMDVTDAIHASGFVKTTKVVGVHYDTFGFIKIDHNDALKQFSDAGITLLLPTPGETIEL